jgi:hypothetical protein
LGWSGSVPISSSKPGGLCPDHATIAQFRARHGAPLDGLSCQVLRLRGGEGIVALGRLSLDRTKLGW